MLLPGVLSRTLLRSLLSLLLDLSLSFSLLLLCGGFAIGCSIFGACTICGLRLLLILILLVPLALALRLILWLAFDFLLDSIGGR